MKFADINRRFTEKVAEYISKGWTINTSSFRDSQGELGKVDLTDGKRIVRILLDDFRDDMTRDERHEFGWHCFSGVKLVVGFDTDGCTPFNQNSMRTPWNHHLDVIEEEKFYGITERFSDNMWYGTLEEAKQAAKLRKQRYKVLNNTKIEDITDRAKDIALKWVRKQPRCKTCQAKEINSVVRRIDWNGDKCRGTRYIIYARGKQFDLQ